jgi:hypothetical protein
VRFETWSEPRVDQGRSQRICESDDVKLKEPAERRYAVASIGLGETRAYLVAVASERDAAESRRRGFLPDPLDA